MSLREPISCDKCCALIGAHLPRLNRLPKCSPHTCLTISSSEIVCTVWFSSTMMCMMRRGGHEGHEPLCWCCSVDRFASFFVICIISCMASSSPLSLARESCQWRCFRHKSGACVFSLNSSCKHVCSRASTSSLVNVNGLSICARLAALHKFLVSGAFLPATRVSTSIWPAVCATVLP